MTITVLAWLGALVVFVFCFGFPEDPDGGDQLAILLMLPGILIGGAIYWDLGYPMPPVGSDFMILFVMFSGLASLGLYSFVGMIKLLGTPSYEGTSSFLQGMISILGLIASVLTIVGFYLDFISAS